MPGLVRAANYVALAFLGALAATVAVRLLVGGINTRNLLYGRKAGGTLYFSPERIQLLLFTIWTATSYLLGVAETRGSGKLPDIPSTTLALFGGSQALYLGGKAYSMLFSRLLKGEG
jgi:hypothetical protein